MTTDDRQALINYLRGLGASEEDLLQHRDDLLSLSSLIALRLGRPTLTLEEVAARAGVPVESILRCWRAAGFSDPGPNLPILSDIEAEMFIGITQAERFFGRDAFLQLTRVIGSASSRVADAVVSTFVANIPVREGAGDLAVAKANTEALILLPSLFRALEVFLRRHIMLARRSTLDVGLTAGVEIQHLTIGFVDLVDSTALAQELSTADLAAALTEFESLVADTVTEHGARVVKLIGDEVMYCVANPLTACRIALVLSDALLRHRVLPPVRIGIAVGAVMSRDGDCFGPVVNLAARAVKIARPGRIVVSSEVSAAVCEALVSTPLPAIRLKGFDGETQLFEIYEMT